MREEGRKGGEGKGDTGSLLDLPSLRRLWDLRERCLRGRVTVTPEAAANENTRTS